MGSPVTTRGHFAFLASPTLPLSSLSLILSLSLSHLSHPLFLSHSLSLSPHSLSPSFSLSHSLILSLPHSLSLILSLSLSLSFSLPLRNTNKDELIRTHLIFNCCILFYLNLFLFVLFYYVLVVFICFLERFLRSSMDFKHLFQISLFFLSMRNIFFL